MKSIILSLTFFIYTSLAGQPSIIHRAECDLLWEFADLGRDIGQFNNLLPFDYGNDGEIEMITKSRFYGAANHYSWSVIKYNPERDAYEQVYVSERYVEPIYRIILADINNDAIEELLLIEKNNLHIIDINSHSTIATVALTGIWNVFQEADIDFGDVDNDGENEIVIGGSSKLNIVNAQSFAVERVLSRYAARFEIGNVDDDPATEIAFYTGDVLEITGDIIVNEYTFHSGTSNSYGLIEMADIDNDQKEEVIITLAWDSLLVYDMETVNLKYGKYTDGSISALTVTDIENDGNEEIVYSINQWGDVFCVRAINGSQLWKITNKGDGTMACAVADFDQDNIKELVWTTSEDDDHGSLHVYSAVTRIHEWNNFGTSDPAFAVSVADIDGDLSNEIITVGNEFGRIRIFDALTKKIKYESPPDMFEIPDFGFYNILIDDYQNDGDLDIIIGADIDDQGAIYVIDGDLLTLETSHIFPNTNISPVFDLAYADVNNDGIKEFIVIASSDIFVIHATTFQTIWSGPIFGNQFVPNKNVLIGNADLDDEPEIIVTNGKLYLFDNTTFEMKQSSSEYHAAMLIDWDHDGKNEIMATPMLGGYHILETEQLSVIAELPLIQAPITGFDTIDINHDGVDEFIGMSNGQIMFFDRAGRHVISQFYTYDMGLHDGLVVKDLDGNGTDEVILGTERGVLQLDLSCASCLWFEADLLYTDPKCNEDNGTISFHSADTSASYFLNGIEVVPPLDSLKQGSYGVIAQNSSGCRIEAALYLDQKPLDIDLHTYSQTCSGEEDGTAFIIIHAVNPPYDVLWSNGATTDTIQNIAAGNYTVTLTDSLGCIFIDSTEVYKDTLLSGYTIIKPACAGQNDGRVRFDFIWGDEPIQIYWDGVPGIYKNDSLSAGTHTVLITDAGGCSNTHVIEIPGDTVEVNVELISPYCSELNSGSAVAQTVSGIPPFTYTWSNNINTAMLNDVLYGIYSVIVSDSKNCFAYDTIEIPSSITDVSFTVSPLICYGDSSAAVSLNSITGIGPYTFNWSNGSMQTDVTNLYSGIHEVTITDVNGCNILYEVFIASPPPIIINMQINNDDDATPELEGSITATPMGGAEPYQFIWSSGHTGNIAGNLADGAYTLTVIDQNGCSTDTIIVLPYFPSPLCLTDGIIFSRQSQLDSFKIRYPYCEVIEGNVAISGTDIQSLDGLSNIHTINGHLQIYYNPTLPTIAGLDALRNIGGSLVIDNNVALQNLNGLEVLSGIQKDFRVRRNISLTSIEGLQALAYVGESIKLDSNVILESLAGLNLIQTIHDSLQIEDNNLLVTLEGLSVDSVNGPMLINYNDNLESLQGLNSLTYIKGLVWIYGNPKLQNLGGLNSLSDLPSGLWMGNNLSLSSLEGAPGLTSIGEYGLVLTDNPSLIDFTGMENIESINGQFYLNNNQQLSSFNGLSDLDTVKYMSILYSDALENMSGLESVKYIHDGIVLRYNEGLIDLKGLDSVTLGDGTIWITDNPDLISLSGLENISRVKNSFSLEANESLTDISALRNIDYTSMESFTLEDLPSLSDCAIKSICDYLSHDGEYAYISGNAPGCNTVSQVRTACLTDVDDIHTDKISIHSNPVSDHIILNGLLPENTFYRINDFTGKLIINAELSGNLIYVEGLPPGIYLLNLHAGGDNVTFRFFKE